MKPLKKQEKKLKAKSYLYKGDITKIEFLNFSSLYTNVCKNTFHLIILLEENDYRIRFALVEISRRALRRYVLGKWSLLQVFKNSRELLIYDTFYKIKSHRFILNAQKVTFNNLSKKYVPLKSSFLSQDIKSDDVRELEICSYYKILRTK